MRKKQRCYTNGGVIDSYIDAHKKAQRFVQEYEARERENQQHLNREQTMGNPLRPEYDQPPPSSIRFYRRTPDIGPKEPIKSPMPSINRSTVWTKEVKKG